MFTKGTPSTLSRRGSKLLVELVIGVIGILGVMLAQNTEYSDNRVEQLASHQGNFVQSKVVGVTRKVDWLDLLLF